uniref:(northern house mosquito) hypothetical protein n=1 Tax=Culex pipiens TaxID=7175 RepID=A0A8D8JFU6_CULPI
MLNFSYLLLSTVYFQSESKKKKRKTLLKALNIFILSVLAVFNYSIFFLCMCRITPRNKAKKNERKQYKRGHPISELDKQSKKSTSFRPILCERRNIMIECFLP